MEKKFRLSQTNEYRISEVEGPPEEQSAKPADVRHMPWPSPATTPLPGGKVFEPQAMGAHPLKSDDEVTASVGYRIPD